MSYQIIEKYDDQVKLKPWNITGTTDSFDIRVSMILTSNNQCVSIHDLNIGDYLWYDNTYWRLYEYSVNKLYDTSEYLKNENYPKYFANAFPFIRVLNRKNSNLKFIFILKLLEFTYVNRSPDLLSKAVSLSPENLKPICEFFEKKINNESVTDSLSKSLIYTDHLNFIADQCIIASRSCYDNLLKTFQFKIKVYNIQGQVIEIKNPSGQMEITLLKKNENYHIIYSAQEKASIDFPKSLVFNKTYSEIEKKSLLKPNNKTLLENKLKNLKKALKSIVIEAKTKEIIEPLVRNKDFLISAGINKNFLNTLTCQSCSETKRLLVLECGHKYCSYCFNNHVSKSTNSLIALNDFEKVNELTCSTCFQLIPETFLELNLKNYSNFKEDADKRAIKTCRACKMQKNCKEFLTKCGHMCYLCQADSIRASNNRCKYCDHITTHEEINKFLNIIHKCDGCWESRFLIKEFGKRYCDHIFCIMCLDEDELRMSMTCYFDQKAFNLSKSEYAMLFKNECKICKDTIMANTTYWKSKNCQCQICESCLLKEYHTAEKPDICPQCEMKFTESFLGYVKREYENWRKRQEITNTCNTCYTEICIDDIINFVNCNHNICKFCFREHCKELFSDISKIEYIKKCPICQTVDIDPSQLNSLLTEKEQEKLNTFQVLSTGEEIINCPKCKEPFQLSMSRKAICVNQNCNYSFCKQCKEPFHENGDCEEVFIQERIDLLKNEAGGVTQCPRCRWPYIKNTETCQHATCINPKCSIDFCFTCACIRSPTMEHGNHYHRPECEYFSQYDGKDDKQEKGCSECVRLGHMCTPPKSLRTPRVVEKDEII